MSVGDNIRRLRKRAGLTQDELAQKLDVSRTTITQWERGWSMPRARRLHLIADTLHSSYDEIVSDKTDIGASYPDSLIPLLTAKDIEQLLLDGDSLRGIVAHNDEVTPSNKTAFDVHAALSTPTTSVEKYAFPNVEIPPSILRHHKKAVALLMQDDCMSRIAPKGMIIVFDPSLIPTNGQVAILHTNEYGILARRLYCGSSNLMLVADSHDTHDDIVLSRESAICIVGTAIWVQALYEF